MHWGPLLILFKFFGDQHKFFMASSLCHSLVPHTNVELLSTRLKANNFKNSCPAPKNKRLQTPSRTGMFHKAKKVNCNCQLLLKCFGLSW